MGRLTVYLLKYLPHMLPVAVLALSAALSGTAYGSSTGVPVVDLDGNVPGGHHLIDSRSTTHPSNDGSAGVQYSGASSSKFKHFTISWDISQGQDGIWTYRYEFSGSQVDEGVSHFTVEVSPTFTDANILEVFDDLIIEGPGSIFSDDGEGLEPPSFAQVVEDFDLPIDGGTKGIKFEPENGDDVSVVRFRSNRSPIWGDFVVKKGQDYAYNTGIGVDPADNIDPFLDRSYFIAWIPTPDTFPEPPTNPIPMPSAAGGFLCFAVGLGLRQVLRRRRPETDLV